MATSEINADDSAETMVAKLKGMFQAEAYDLLAELESALLQLEKTPGDQEVIGRAFRALHTIKGSGGSCEFHEVAAFAHEFETVFDLVRKSKLQASKDIISLGLAARDQMLAMFDVYYKGGAADAGKAKEIVASFKKLCPAIPEKETASHASGPMPNDRIPPSDASGNSVTYRIRFRPASGMLKDGTDPVLLLNDMRRLGHCEVVTHTDAIPELKDHDPEACYTSWDVILTTCAGINAVRDVFIFVVDTSEVKIDVLYDGKERREYDVSTYRRLSDILLDRADLTADDLQQALKTKKQAGELNAEKDGAGESKGETALPEQQPVGEPRERLQGAEPSSSIRVATEKLDSLVNLVGELVTVQARLSQTALVSNVPGLLSVAEEVERLTGELRERTMSIRMLPIGTMFGKYQRLVRDLSLELGKEAELLADGAETELDKTVIERLDDPLVHLIRNSLDHGAESADARESAGKPKKNTIRLSAFHSGAHVFVRLSDDGAGLDVNAIRAKAIEKGLVAADTELTDEQLCALVLAPGFSTAKKVTNVSGRGVGMDVVKSALDTLQGSIQISSQPGAGTTITLRLPLTLAIIDGFLTRIGAESFVFPLSVVEECVELTRTNAAKANGRTLAHIRGEIVPYVRLRERFAIHDEAPLVEQIVIVNVDGNKVGFVVDQVIGDHQTVIKNLGRFYRDVEGISGATILGDGTVALILDVRKLVQSSEKEEIQFLKKGELSIQKTLA